MSTKSGLPEPDIAQAVRDFLCRGSRLARETLAVYGVSYIRNFLLKRQSLRSFGFPGSFRDAAEEVADLEVAELLCEGPEGSTDATVLLRRLARVLSLASPPLAGSRSLEPNSAILADVLDRSGEDIELAYRRILRLRADQGLRRRWMEEHPQEARLLRSLKGACRTAAGLRLHRDSRGIFLVGTDSDLRMRALTDVEVRGCLEATHLRSAREVLSHLGPLLVAGENHGGYCYLMDLVRAVHVVHRQRFELWCQSDVFSPGAGRLTGTGIPVKLLLEKLRRSLGSLAEEILARDGRGVAASVRRAWVDVAVEMVMRRYGLLDDEGDPQPKRPSDDGGDPQSQRRSDDGGDPQSQRRSGDGGDPQSQRRLLEARLGEDWSAESAAFHEGQTTYLVRRLRKRWER